MVVRSSCRRERFELRHGHYSIEAMVYRQCKPFDIDVPIGDDIVTFVFVTEPDDPPNAPACVPLGVQQRVVKF